MPSPFGLNKSDNPSTYVLQKSMDEKELERLIIQDHLLTGRMGGVLPEQVNPTVFHYVLDVGCGPGGWIIETAKTYPTASLVAIDVSTRMIKYASAQAKEHQVGDRVEFLVMDALQPLEFPTDTFDLVNLRFGMSFLRTWDWPRMLNELFRVTHPGGVVRLTEGEVVEPSSSSALDRLFEVGQCALYRAGHLFTPEKTGLTAHLAPLLKQSGSQQIQTKAFAIESRAGTEEGETHCQDLVLIFRNAYPFLQKWGCAPKDYKVIYQQALNEIRQADFQVTWNLVTVWGQKPPISVV